MSLNCTGHREIAASDEVSINAIPSIHDRDVRNRTPPSLFGRLGDII